MHTDTVHPAHLLRIFGCFPLQEIGSLAYRGEDDDSISDTISLTTELELDSVVRETGDKEERALIMSASRSAWLRMSS